jgi:hypothetical protein
MQSKSQKTMAINNTKNPTDIEKSINKKSYFGNRKPNFRND